jgi:hypothetical protein
MAQRVYLVAPWPCNSCKGYTLKGETVKEYTITRLSFEELSPEAQALAVQNERDDLYNNIPEEFISEDIRQELAEQLGSPDYALGLELRYSLSYSQGDGVSFTGTLTRQSAPALTWPAGAERAELISITPHYSHANTVRAELIDAEGETLDDSSAVELFREQIRDVCKVLERVGYKSIEDYSSEYSARECLRDAGEVFLASGVISKPLGVLGVMADGVELAEVEA